MELFSAACSGQQKVAFQIMKTHHPAATGPFHPAADPPRVSSLPLEHSAETLSQEARAWRKERCVCVSHSPKNISHVPPVLSAGLR